MAMFSYSVISLVIRGVQTIFTIIVLGLTGHLVDRYDGIVDKFNIGLATSVISLVYFIWLGIGYYNQKIINIGIGFILEIILNILWLTSFACLADVWGSSSCNFAYFYFVDKTVCQVGKAGLSFAILNWILFLISLGLMIFYTIIPISKQSGFANCFSFSHWCYPGVIFYRENTSDNFNHQKGSELPESSTQQPSEESKVAETV